MERTGGWIVAVLILAVVAVSGCGGSAHESSGTPPVRLAHIPGTGSFARLVLSPDANARIGVQTARAGTMVAPDGTRMVDVPYAAVLYDANGVPSLYTSPAPRVYYRRPIRIDHIAGKVAILKQGPSAGTAVVVVGAEELFGAETGVQAG